MAAGISLISKCGAGCLPFCFFTYLITPSCAEKAGGVVAETACIVELPLLGGRAKLGGAPLYVLVEKDVE
jgi:hypothetical protein